MKNLKEGSLCPLCGGGKMSLVEESVTFKYKGKEKEAGGFQSFKCPSCEDGFLLKESKKRFKKEIMDFRREIEGLLTSDEIKAIREKHGLLQDQLSALLGMTPKTINRYENGNSMQSKSVDLFLRAIREYPETLKFLSDHNGIEISEKKLQKSA